MRKIRDITFTSSWVSILLAAHFFVLLYLLYITPDYTSPDSARYLYLADAISDFKFGLETPHGYEPESLRLPGYPLFIFVCQTIFGKSQIAIVLVQMSLHLLAIYALYKVCKVIIGESAGIFFLLISLFFPVITFSTTYILPDSLSVTLVAFGIYGLAMGYKKESYWLIIFAGLFFGMACSMRTNILPLPFVIAFFVFLLFKSYRKQSLVFIGIALLTISPWFVRNFVVFGSLTGSSANVGFETVLYQATVNGRIAAEQGSLFKRVTMPDKYEDLPDSPVKQQMQFIKQELGFSKDDSYFRIVFDLPSEKAPYAKQLLREKAIENIGYSPSHFLTQSISNLPRMWMARSDTPPPGFPEIPGIIALGFGLFVLLSAIAGGLISFFKAEAEQRFVLFCALLVVAFFSLSLCFLTFETRYANPGKLPLIMLTAYFCSMAMNYIKGPINTNYPSKLEYN